jgi:hypothetical protein
LHGKSFKDPVMSHEDDYDYATYVASVRTEKRKASRRTHRAPTPREVKCALVKLGYKDPATVTVERLCRDVYYNFYKARPGIPEDQRDPTRDCKLCPVFGQACDLLGLITDQHIQEHYLWIRSGAMVIVDSDVDSQIVCFIDIVQYINERVKQEQAEAWFVIEDEFNDEYVHVNYDDEEEAPESTYFTWSSALSSITQNFGALLGLQKSTEG